jgi:hypothetical protein
MCWLFGTREPDAAEGECDDGRGVADLALADHLGHRRHLDDAQLANVVRSRFEFCASQSLIVDPRHENEGSLSGEAADRMIPGDRLQPVAHNARFLAQFPVGGHFCGFTGLDLAHRKLPRRVIDRMSVLPEQNGAMGVGNRDDGDAVRALDDVIVIERAARCPDHVFPDSKPGTSENDRASPFGSFSPRVDHRGRPAGDLRAAVPTLVSGERPSQVMLLRQAGILIRLRGITVARGHRLVTVADPAELDARSRRRAHEGIDCVLKNTEAFERAFEDRVIKRREKRYHIAGYPGQQLSPEYAGGRAVACRRGKARQRLRWDRSAAMTRRTSARCPRARVLASRPVLEPSAAPDDVPYGRRGAAIFSRDLGDCFAAGILGQNLRPFTVRDLSFYSWISHHYSRILVMHL